MRVDLRYGQEGLEASLPDANVGRVLRFRSLPAVGAPQEAARAAMAAPLGCAPLRELAAPCRDAVVVTSDITRPVPNRVILPVVLGELEAAGVPPARVTVLIGTGLHRPSIPSEQTEMLGSQVLRSGASIINHVARANDTNVRVGTTSRGTPAFIDRAYVEADLKITVSLVEPHLMAGFSGGRKAICPGICGMETIRHFHGPALLASKTAAAGILDGNSVHEEALEVARLAGAPDLTVNVTLDEARQLTGVFAGDLEQCHLAAVERSVAQSKVAIPEAADIVVTTNAGHPLDLTFYQGVKGMIVAVPILKPGGTIIIAHECAEGIGGPEFTQLLLETHDIGDFEDRLADPDFFSIDQWQLQELSKVLTHAGQVLNLSGGVPGDQLAQCFVTPIGSIEEGVEVALTKHGRDARIAVIPEGPYVLACLEGDEIDRQRFGDTR